MSDNTERPADGAAPRDPWAPPDNRVPLDKNTGDTSPQTDGGTGTPGSPRVHDQQTVTSMPGVGTGPIPTAGFGPPDQGQPAGPGGWQGPGPGSVPPPPVGPNGPGQGTPPPAGQYGYPAPPQPQYGYPAPPVPQYGDYAGYGGQPVWGATGPANGMGTAAMVLGILAICLFCVYGIPSLILGILALIFGIIGRKRVGRGEADNAGQALAGIIMGSIGIAIGVIIIGSVIWLFAAHADEFDDDTTYDDTYGTSLIVEDAR
ncbi:DUF4190 domain-containing protein [Streptomyces sp. NPDC087901]|uniref:DUF4190 domain-containing protein n=1 Tax=unclassified Streptomyces TaxID=2593676 RepID=UPI00341235D5